MRKVEVVFSERVFHPGGHPDQAGTIYFISESAGGTRIDDRVFGKPSNFNLCTWKNCHGG